MKQLILGFVLIIFSTNLFAQEQSVNANAEKATQDLTSLYQLDQVQAAKVLKIQQTRFKNLEQVEAIKDSNKPLYRQKLKNIEEIANGALRNLLNPSQLAKYEVIELDRQKQRQEKIKRMKAEGASKEDIQRVISGH